MTKRKAIETALICTCGKSQCNQRTRRPEIAADHAYELGRIAGLREAASAANERSDAEKYRQWANELAKKVRTK